MSRPKDPFIIWAEDENYPAGPNDWNGTPTRVRPSSGKIREGFEPDEAPPATWANYAIGRLSDFVDYLERIDVCNWKAPVVTGLVFGGRAVHIANNGVIRIGGRFAVASTIFKSTDGGHTFPESDVETPGDGTGIHLMAGSPTFSKGAIVALPDPTGSSDRWVITRNSGAWSASLVVSSRDWRSIAYVDRDDAFIVTGKNITTNKGWVARINVADPPTITTGTVTSDRADPIQLQAHNANVSVFLDLGGWCWTWTGGALNLTPRGHVISDIPLGLAWWETAGVFIAVTATGLVYTSEDGALWSEVHDAGGSVWTGTIACLGGVCIAEKDDENFSLWMSVDGGVNWERASIGPIQEPTDISGFGHFDPSPASQLVAGGGRFLYVANVVDEAFFSQSLKVRT